MTPLEQAQADLSAAELAYISTTTAVTTAQSSLTSALGSQQTAITDYITALKNAVAIETGLLSGFAPPVTPVVTP